MNHFDSKVAIVTGSSLGIGKAIAIKLLELNCKVVITARNEQRLANTYKEIKKEDDNLLMVSGDVSNLADCKLLIEKTIGHFGQIDILINNAGLSMEGEVAELNPEVFKNIIDVNYLGSVFPSQLAIPYLKITKGSILFVSSLAAIRGLPGFAPYASSKMALTALSESLAIELKPFNIHVGIAYLGFTKNDPEKTIYNKDGKLIPQPSRNSFKQKDVSNVALKIIQMIRRRKFKSYFNLMGTSINFLNRIFPRIYHFILGQLYKKYQSE